MAQCLLSLVRNALGVYLISIARVNMFEIELTSASRRESCGMWRSFQLQPRRGYERTSPTLFLTTAIDLHTPKEPF